MKNRKRGWEKGEPSLPGFSFNQEVGKAMQEYKAVGQALDDLLSVGPAKLDAENEFELDQEIAVALKQELRASGISRETFCDLVNKFLGRTQDRYKADPPQCRRPLTKCIVDKWISAPTVYPIDSYYLFAFQHVFRGHGVMNAILGASGARVVSGEDLRRVTLLKAQKFREAAQKLEKGLGRI